MWRSTWLRNAREAHVYPVVDVREHDETPRCWCCPTPEVIDGGTLYVHHAQMPSYTKRSQVARVRTAPTVAGKARSSPSGGWSS
jgi:hypothetical protein